MMQSYMTGFYHQYLKWAEADWFRNKSIPLVIVVIAQVPDMAVPAYHVIKQFCEEGEESHLFDGVTHLILTG